jgi:hypothetical protein
MFFIKKERIIDKKLSENLQSAETQEPTQTTYNHKQRRAKPQTQHTETTEEAHGRGLLNLATDTPPKGLNLQKEVTLLA